MPLIPKPEIHELALLARLHLEPEEVERMQHDLGAILDHFTQLATIDTENVAPMTHAVPMDLRLRLDVVESSLPVATALAATPKRDGDFIVVPAIISGSES